MYICFAVYHIAPEYRNKYLAAAKRLELEASGRMKLYEGCDQAGLFVEVWTEQDEASAEKRKEERLSGHSSWSELSSYIAGGETKLHVWTFKPVSDSEPS